MNATLKKKKEKGTGEREKGKKYFPPKQELAKCRDLNHNPPILNRDLFHVKMFFKRKKKTLAFHEIKGLVVYEEVIYWR